MINNLRLSKIIKILLESNKIVTGEQLCTTVGVSSRTIRSDIKELNDIFENHGAVILSEKGKGYVLEITDEEKFKELYSEEKKKDNYINLTAEGRAEYIITKLLLNEMKNIDAITQIDLADELFISLSSLKNDIKLAKLELINVTLDIEKFGNKGIRITGREDSIRCCISKKMNSSNQLFLVEFEKILKDSLGIENLYELEEIIKTNITKFKLRLSDIAFKDLRSYIAVMLVRNKNHYNVIYTESMINDLKKESKIEIAESICNDLMKKLNVEIDETEVCYVTKHIIASSLIGSNKDEYNNQLTEMILISVKENFNLDLTSDKVLIDFLGTHLKASINRAKYGIKLENSMLSIIKNNYPFAFEIGVLSNNIIRNQYGINLSEADIGFLSLHFAASIERLKELDIGEVKRAIIVCTTGVGTSLLLKVKIERYFKERLKVVETIPWYEFNDEILKNVDFIITTVPLNVESEKVIHVKNLLDNNELKLIEKKLQSNNYKENDLNYKFKKELFFKDIEASTRDELLENITNSLISENYITKAVKKEIFSREELASTEIGNLVAIPHTSHNDLEESFISVAILKKPIIWHKEKVQVVLIICIAEKDKHEWKSNLEQLYKSIIELDVVLEIIKSNDFQEFKKIVCKF